MEQNTYSLFNNQSRNVVVKSETYRLKVICIHQSQNKSINNFPENIDKFFERQQLADSDD